MRNVIYINKDWTFSPHDSSRKKETVDLPHTWNAEDGQDGGNDYLRTCASYSKKLKISDFPEDGCVWLEIEAAALSAAVYVDGKKFAEHHGGFSAFRIELTETVKNAQGEYLHLEITCDNRENKAVYPQKADFTFYGGLYRNVKIIQVPRAHFDLSYYGSPGIKITPILADDLKSAEIEIEAYTEHAEGEIVSFGIEGAGTAEAAVKNGKASVTMPLHPVRLWNGRKDPYLYSLRARLESGDEITQTFACRKFHVDPQKGAFLNNEAYPLRGVSRHQDRKGKGNALSLKDHEEDLSYILEMGANTVRLAHYQHAEEFYTLCDRAGLMVWAEIPYITMHQPEGKENTLSQMRELIVQNYHHPSIICWGLSNEITAVPVFEDDRLDHHRKLQALCKALDPTRYTAMAHVFMLETDDPLVGLADLAAYNLYFGWYLGELEQNDAFFDAFHAAYPDKPVALSEYGADANPALQSSRPYRGDYSEGYQCLYHEHMLEMISRRPWLWASYVWNMFDFGADGRDEGGKHGENQKGLITFDRKIKKDAFYLYKAYWSEEAFVHICGRRYKERNEERSEIKVYSNQSPVSLYLDGNFYAKKHGEKIFRFTIPLSARHSIRAEAGGKADEIEIVRTPEDNPDYFLNKTADIRNWFDDEAYDPSCYSIEDTLGELRQNPQIAQKLDQMMQSGAENRGDVAEAVKDNPNLIRMMSRMTLRSLLQQMNDTVSEDDIKRLNAYLQSVKKE